MKPEEPNKRRSNDAATLFRSSNRARLELSRRSFLRAGLGALTTPMLSGCNFSENPTEPGSEPRLSARPGTPSIEPTLGLSELGLESDRDGLLYVPQTHSWDNPAPLFVGLHGAGGEASDWASYPDRAEARGMVFLAPDSRLSTWDLSTGGRFGSDLEFLNLALQHSFERCSIDSSRIALGGFSDGASYALSLGVSNGDLFSHLVAYSPGYFTPSEPLVGKPPVYVSHGTNDSVLPVEISREIIVPALRDAGHDVSYQEFNGDHEVPLRISDAALDWFLGVG